jgi:hypothetical protein
MRFRLFTCSPAILFSGVDIQKAIHSQLRLHTDKWRGTACWWEARLIEAWIIEVLLYLLPCFCAEVIHAEPAISPPPKLRVSSYCVWNKMEEI